MKKFIQTLLWLAAAFAITLGVSFAQSAQVQSQPVAFQRFQKLMPSDGRPGDSFGYSVALTKEGALVGTPFKDTATDGDSGGVYLFDFRERIYKDAPPPILKNNSKSTVDFQKNILKLIAPDGRAGDQFGRAIAMGTRYILVGATTRDDQGGDSGAVYVFDAQTGEILRRLNASDGSAGDLFGYSVAVWNNFGLVGAPYKDQVGGDSGAAYLFDLSSGRQIEKLVPSDSKPGDLFGYAVALQDGRALVSSTYDDTQGHDSGSVYLFPINTDSKTWKFPEKDAPNPLYK